MISNSLVVSANFIHTDQFKLPLAFPFFFMAPASVGAETLARSLEGDTWEFSCFFCFFFGRVRRDAAKGKMMADSHPPVFYKQTYGAIVCYC